MSRLVGKIILAYRHPQLPTEVPTAGIITGVDGAREDNVYVHVCAFARDDKDPHTRRLGPMPILRPDQTMLPGWRGNWICHLLEEVTAAAAEEPASPKPVKSTGPAKR